MHSALLTNTPKVCICVYTTRFGLDVFLSYFFYFVVPRILGPIVTCLEVLKHICEKDEGMKNMVSLGFGGLDKLRRDILYDLFRSAFDGSGADNFYDAGSCIDGRMTPA
jgi:hypothetical protein